MWCRPLSDMITSADAVAEKLRLDFQLHENYPNPFNPSTTIRYELPKASIVRLSVYDILGREVSVLVNERKNAGAYQVKFDAAGLASGLYLYRLTAGSFVQTRRDDRIEVTTGENLPLHAAGIRSLMGVRPAVSEPH